SRARTPAETAAGSKHRLLRPATRSPRRPGPAPSPLEAGALHEDFAIPARATPRGTARSGPRAVAPVLRRVSPQLTESAADRRQGSARVPHLPSAVLPAGTSADPAAKSASQAMPTMEK